MEEISTIKSKMDRGTHLSSSRKCRGQECLAKVILAPMVRGSELAFRTLVRKNGIRQCYSPMLRATEIVKAYQVYNAAKEESRKCQKTLRLDDVLSQLSHEDGKLLLTDILLDKEPLTVQMCGFCPTTLQAAIHALMELQHSSGGIAIQLQTSRNIESQTTFQPQPHIVGIDFNLGCPQSCAFHGNFGAFLAENDPNLTIKCVEAMKQALEDFFSGEDYSQSQSKRPKLSCKIRLRKTYKDTLDFANELILAGCQVLAIHCRHRVEKHNGHPDLDVGRRLVQELPIPVIVNGCIIQSLQDLENSVIDMGSCLDENDGTDGGSTVHGIMIGRKLLENPMLFTNQLAEPANLAAEYLDCVEQYPPPSPLYIQKHLRWIFRSFLDVQSHPKPLASSRKEHVALINSQATRNRDYSDWRTRLWTFLVRPFLTTLGQFRQIVCLYVILSGSTMPPSLAFIPKPTFKSIRHGQNEGEIRNYDPRGYDENEESRAGDEGPNEMMINLFQ